MPQQKLWTPEFIGMGLTNFFYFMSQYILIAALPVFIMDDLGDGQLAAGMAMTCFQIGTVCTRPIAGRIIDGVNKQKLLLISTVFFVLIMGGFLLASNSTWFTGFVLSMASSLPSARPHRQPWRLSSFLPKERAKVSATLPYPEIWPWSSGLSWVF